MQLLAFAACREYAREDACDQQRTGSRFRNRRQVAERVDLSTHAIDRDAATVSPDDVFAVNTTTGVLVVQDYPTYSTSSTPITFHTITPFNFRASGEKIINVNMDLGILPPIATTVGNAALGKTVTVSSVEAWSSYTGNYAVDGNTSTRWSSAYSDPQWITVDLGATFTITEVRITWEEYAFGTNYLIQTSPDNNTWTTQTTVTDNTVGGSRLTYSYAASPISARYVRVYGTAHAYSWGYSIYELAVMGSGTSSGGGTGSYPAYLLGVFDSTVSAYSSAANAVAVRIDPNTATNNLVIQASTASGAMRSVATLSTPLSTITGSHTLGLQLNYAASATAPTVSIYSDGSLLGQATLNGSEGVLMATSGTSQATAVRSFIQAVPLATTATSGANITLDNVSITLFSPGTLTISAPMGTPPVPLSAVSQRVHGGYGTYALPVNIASGSTPSTASTKVECRAGGTTALVITFDKAISSLTANVAAGTATLGQPTYDPIKKTVTIAISGMTNNQNLRLNLSAIQAVDGGMLSNAVITFSHLIGDVNEDGMVTSIDAVLVRNASGLQAGQAGYNTRADVTADGIISSPDAVQVRNNSGLSLP